MTDSRKLVSQDTICSPTPLVYVITPMVANHAPSVPILSQFPSGSMSVNLAFQLSDKTVKSSYNTIPTIGADLALKTSEEVVLLEGSP